MSWSEVWPIILAVASAIVLLANAGEKIGKAIRYAKAPNIKQDDRLSKIEEHIKDIDRFLAQDKKRLDAIEEGNRATQQALLALLDHSIDGNNTDQMKRAKERLTKYLVER